MQKLSSRLLSVPQTEIFLPAFILKYMAMVPLLVEMHSICKARSPYPRAATSGLGMVGRRYEGIDFGAGTGEASVTAAFWSGTQANVASRFKDILIPNKKF